MSLMVYLLLQRNKCRETRSSAHETISMAFEKQLKSTGITREVMAGGKQCAPRPTIAPATTCSKSLQMHQNKVEALVIYFDWKYRVTLQTVII